jgi:hypothetical protein
LVSALSLAAQDSSERRRFPRVRLGGISVNAGYTNFGGTPYWGPGWGYGPYWGAPLWRAGLWADPWWSWYGPFGAPFAMHPAFFTGFANGPGMGEIKLRNADKEAEVYLDGAFAGRAGKLKTIWLEPGKYDLEVRSGSETLSKRLYVLSGKNVVFDLAEERGAK